MDKSLNRESGDDSIAEQASMWVWKVDQGMDASEQDEFMEWLGADPQHGEAYRDFARHFKEFDQLIDWQPIHGASPNPDLFAPPESKVRRFFPLVSGLAASIAIAAGLLFWPSKDQPDEMIGITSSKGEVTLADNSLIHYNDGTKFEVDFSAKERHVTLKSGEAYFSVEKDPSRPFVVEVGGVELVAVGTAFNVRLGEESFEVLIEEGIVEMNGLEAPQDHENLELTESSQAQLLNQFDKAIVSLGPVISNSEFQKISEVELKKELSWQHRMLVFEGNSLEETLLEFNRLNEPQLVLEDPGLARLQISGTIMSDNVVGLCRLLEVSFGISNRALDSGEILLFRS